MIVVKLSGGLGNQLFQYAAAKCLAIKHNVPLKLDITGFSHYPLRPYCLSPFNITAPFCTQEEIDSLKKRTNLERILNRLNLPHARTWYLEKHFHFDPSFFNLSGNVYVDGYFQSEKYFIDIEEAIKKEFVVKTAPSPANEACLKKIETINAVSLHIRRGDYVSNSLTNRVHGVCTLDYYYKAIQFIADKITDPHFFIFSDDMNWVKENIIINHFAVTYVDYNNADNAYEDVRLMCHCKHNIVANSSFSWWGAWLNNNKEKIVVAPEKWFNTSKRNTKDLIPFNWQKNMTDSGKPIISVIMPVYNAELYLKDSIESILNQTYRDFEFLIFNDGSTDKSVDIIRYYAEKDSRIVLFDSKENKGYLEHLNKGLQMARGEYIARMDADDISLPQRFAKQLNYIVKEQLDIIGSDIIYFSDKKRWIKKRSHQAINCKDGLAQMFFSTPLFHPTVFFSRKLYDAGGFIYNADFYPAEDYELWTRILPECKFGNIAEPLLLYRHSAMQISNKKTATQQNKTIEAKVNYIYKMCKHMPSEKEKQVLNDYFFCSAIKKLPAGDMEILFELFRKIFAGLNDAELKLYFCKRLFTSICFYSSRNSPYYSMYKQSGFNKYYNGNWYLKANALIRQWAK